MAASNALLGMLVSAPLLTSPARAAASPPERFELSTGRAEPAFALHQDLKLDLKLNIKAGQGNISASLVVSDELTLKLYWKTLNTTYGLAERPCSTHVYASE
jgi:hypothetical protein